MIDHHFARQFATDWIAAWNSHDLDRILSHYSDDFEMSSPLIVRATNEPSGKLRGKTAADAYWARALMPRTLTLMPDLHFKLVATFVGVDSITLYYRSNRGMVAELFHSGPGGKVLRAAAHCAL